MKNRHLLAIATVVLALGYAALAGAARTEDSESDIVVRASALSQASLHGAWTLAADTTSLDGIKLLAWRPASSARFEAIDRVAAASHDSRRLPLADPDDYADVSFVAAAATPYRVWLRLRAAEAGAGDSVWVQFSDAEVDGSPAYVIDTATALLVSAPPCSDCSTAGWRWVDSSTSFRQPSTVEFTTSGAHTLRIQPRAAGVQVDQILLSPRAHLNAAPGAPLHAP